MIIRHFLADGTEVKDMTGYVVPINSSTIVAYQLLYKKALEREKNIQKNETIQKKSLL